VPGADWLSGESPVAQTKDTAMSALLTTGRFRGVTLLTVLRARFHAQTGTGTVATEAAPPGLVGEAAPPVNHGL
jgi:hypothetical protein